jgi:hypothetical protein
LTGLLEADEKGASSARARIGVRRMMVARVVFYERRVEVRADVRVAAYRAGTLLPGAIHTRVRDARGYPDRAPAAALRTRPDKTV